MRAAMEGAGRKGDRGITKYPDFTPFSREEIDSYLGLILANSINMNPQINLWFLRTHDRTIYGNNIVRKILSKREAQMERVQAFLLYV